MSDAIAAGRPPMLLIRRVPVDRPWTWLAAGWDDVVASWRISLAYGLALVIVGWIGVAMLLWFDLPYLVLPLSAGFFFIGPFAAVGLYEVSRRRSCKLVVDGETTLLAWRRNPGQIALMGLLLLFFHLAWMRMAQLLFAVFEWRTVASWDRFAELAWASSRSLPFLGLGIALGGALAALAFAIGAFSIPYLLDRRTSNVFEAVALSVAIVRMNPRPMLLWAVLIVFLVAVGMVPGLLGLVVTLPLVAHATWHAYRDVLLRV